MTYRNAIRLRVGDKVIPKGCTVAETAVYVIDDVRHKDVLVHTDNGKIYHHTKLK